MVNYGKSPFSIAMLVYQRASNLSKYLSKSASLSGPAYFFPGALECHVEDFWPRIHPSNQGSILAFAVVGPSEIFKPFGD